MFKYTLNKAKEKEIFHGGCLSCYSQEVYDVSRCFGCMYHEPDWDKPDLTVKKSQVKKLKEKEMPSMGYRVPPRPKAPKFRKRKELRYDDRIKSIKNYFSDVQSEYTEANNATNIHNMFLEILNVMPKEALIHSETIGLFKEALEQTIGVENAKTKHKKYI